MREREREASVSKKSLITPHGASCCHDTDFRTSGISQTGYTDLTKLGLHTVSEINGFNSSAKRTSRSKKSAKNGQAYFLPAKIINA